MGVNMVCEFRDRCTMYNKMSIDEQLCCDDDKYQCSIYQKFLDEERKIWYLKDKLRLKGD